MITELFHVYFSFHNPGISIGGEVFVTRAGKDIHGRVGNMGHTYESFGYEISMLRSDKNILRHLGVLP